MSTKNTPSFTSKISPATYLALFPAFLFLFPSTGNAQVAINSSAANPDVSAILDLNAGNTGVNKGFLAPQIALTATNSASPVTSPATGLIIYNTATAGAAPNNVVPGYYYWNGLSWKLILAPDAGTTGQVLTSNGGGNPSWTTLASGGTVTDFSSGSLSPLFTTSVTNSTTTPALSYTLSNAGAYTVLGNNTNTSAVPNYFTPVLASALYQNQGSSTTVLHGNVAGNPSWGAVNLATDVSNNLPVTHLNSGTGASATTFWRGDGTWATPVNAITGSGTNNYLARWTPNGSTLGTGLIQDNGTGVGINYAPTAGYQVIDIAASGTAFGAQTTDASNYAIDAYNYGGTAINVSAVYYGIYSVSSDPSFNRAGVYGEDDNNIGVSGSSTNGYGVSGYSSGGTGVQGYGWDNGGYFAAINTQGTGVFGSSDSSIGAWGSSTEYTGVYGNGGTFGIEGYSANGTAVIGYGPNDYGVKGNSSSNIGVLGQGAYSGGYFQTLASTAFGVVGTGNNTNLPTIPANTGNAFSGASYGLYATQTTNTNTGVAAIYAVDAKTGGNVQVNAWSGGTHYKIIGSNTTSVSCSVNDLDGNKVVLHCPETPEFYFEDYGDAQLVNGKAHIDLDPILAKNVAINDKHPLRVFIQLNDTGCNGVAVMNKTASGFDVIELKRGISNTPFQWHVVCNVKDENENGVINHNQDIRFEKAPVVTMDNANSHVPPAKDLNPVMPVPPKALGKPALQFQAKVPMKN